MLGIRLASGVVTPLVKKLFQGEGAGAGLVDRPVRISSYLAWREKRDLGPADLRALADRLVREALRAPGERPLPPGEEAGVSAALAATLLALGDLSLSDVEAVRLGPQAFARQLRAAGPHPGLSRDAELFHARLVELAGLHILNFFTQRSTFVAATLVEQSRLHAETIAKVDELLTRVPRQDGRDAAFEERYLAYVARRNSALTIFGLDLDPGSSRWPLDAAYVSLEVDRVAPGAARKSQPEGQIGSAAPRHALPADRVLTRYPRVLLRGEAGSGKTTLIQWLAVAAAQDPDAVSMPFVLPLRTLTRHGDSLPAPGDFLAGSALAGEVPEGWESRVLRDGRALLLVDGIDEIPEAERDRARGWLADLITAYPGNRWLVTSRPSAVRHEWLGAEDFAEATLAPMNPADVRAFVERWHTAADAPDGYLTQLLESLRTKPDLARLAANPLLCGLICALHRERRGFLPSGRKELYSASLSMLLHRRDRERGLRVPELAEEPQLQLLQRLAYWLIRNSRTEMDRSRAEALIADALPAVPAARVLGEAPAVFRHLLERTGLLRAPTVDSVEFVHRTFQDFLGARAALDEGSFGELAGHADDDQWEDVIRMAVAQGRPRDRAEIVGGLLDRSSDRAVLLALAALEYATELDPALRAAVEERAAALIPPASSEAAVALGEIGPMILDLLPGPDGLSVPEADRTMAAAAGTRSDAAVPFLRQFCRHPSKVVRSELVALWSRFDTRLYGEQVIARLDPAGVVFTVESDAQLDLLGSLAAVPTDVAALGVCSDALQRFTDRARLQWFGLAESATTHVDFLRGQTGLRYVELINCPRLTDISGLSGLPITTAFVHVIDGAAVADVVSTWPHLKELSLGGTPGPWSLDALAPDVSLTRLDISECLEPVSVLPGLERHRELRRLDLGANWVPAEPAEWRTFAGLHRLEELIVPREALAVLPPSVVLPSVRLLITEGDSREHVPGTVQRQFPNAAIHD